MLTGIPALCDLDARLRGMDQFGDYRQVLTLVPFLHLRVAQANPGAATELVRVANDSIAEVASKHPERFIGFVSSLPQHDPGQAIRELDRTVTQMGALGVQLEANANGLPLDEPRFDPCSPDSPISASLFGFIPRVRSPHPTTPARGRPDIL
jgi:aminocarboxymuconate-semialdehyde decarboxylase